MFQIERSLDNRIVIALSAGLLQQTSKRRPINVFTVIFFKLSGILTNDATSHKIWIAYCFRGLLLEASSSICGKTPEVTSVLKRTTSIRTIANNTQISREL